MRRRRIGLVGLVILGVHALLIICPGPAYAGPTPAATGDVNSELPWHPAVLDPQGNLLAWYRPQQNLGFDEVLHLGWDFIEHKIPDERGPISRPTSSTLSSTGSLQGAYWQSNPSMVFGSFVDSALAGTRIRGRCGRSARSGHARLPARLMAPTPPNWSWSGVPFPTGCGNQTGYGRCLSDMTEELLRRDRAGQGWRSWVSVMPSITR